jgi:twitching motility protein PilI
VDEVFGQRTVDAEQRRDAEREDDPRLTRFVEDRVEVDGQRLALFSMGKLVRAPDFRQAAG